MKTSALILAISLILGSFPLGAETQNPELFKTGRESRREENKRKNVKAVPRLSIAPTPMAKVGPEVNCTTDTGETLGPKDKGHEQCLIDTKKPTKMNTK